MNSNQNYYQLLHLHQDAPQAMIKAAYRTIMQKLKAHPDLGGDADHAALINHAYEVLSNKELRAAYDQKLNQKAQAKSQRSESGASAKTQSRTRSEPTPEQERYRNAESGDSTNSGQPKSATHFCLFCNASIGYAEQESCSVCESPLGSIRDAERESAASDNRRGIFRMPKTGPVSFCSQSEFLALNSHSDFLKRRAGKMRFGSAQDISPTGMRMRCSEKLAASEILRIESNSLVAVAIIANHKQEGPRENSYGLKFISLQLKQSRGGFVSTAV